VSAAIQTALLNLLIRMVVPMRREFGQSLDVQQFLRDDGYARQMLERALAAQDPRLRDYAQQVNQHLGGPRAADPPLAAQAPAEPPPADGGDAASADMRARMLRKYTSGLR
jgi:hypothetical protein